MDRGYEHDLLEREIIVRVNDSGLARVWKQPTGAAYRDGRLVHYGLKGCADITGLTVNGIRVEIEVKTGKAVQSQYQVKYETMINNFSGIYIVARDVDGILDTLRDNVSKRNTHNVNQMRNEK